MTTSTQSFPSALDLRLISRRPPRLSDATVRVVLNRPIPHERLHQDRRFKQASIVVVTWNNLVFTRFCLESVLANTEYPNYEIVVVDNGSTDGTPAYLRALARRHPHIQVIQNAANRGFGPATNQGLAQATGDVLVILNEDTLVSRGWLTRLVGRLGDRELGLVGPATNRTCNEAQVAAPYQTFGEFTTFARERSWSQRDKDLDVSMLALFCAATRRDVYERVGPLDERFVVGMFEDDDYARRLRAAGYRLKCAEDAFVHHFGQAGLGRLAGGEFGELFHANRKRFEAKWGVNWEPHERRPGSEYLALVARVREAVRLTVPPEASVIVVNKGDERLLQLDGRPAGHFPQDESGGYAGYYPADSAQAIAHLETLRGHGAEYLLFPNTSLWWLEQYEGLNDYLVAHYSIAAQQPGTCVIYDLHESETSG